MPNVGATFRKVPLPRRDDQPCARPRTCIPLRNGGYDSHFLETRPKELSADKPVLNNVLQTSKDLFPLPRGSHVTLGKCCGLLAALTGLPPHGNSGD